VAAPLTTETVLVTPAVLKAAVAMVMLVVHHPSLGKGGLRNGDEQHPDQEECGNNASDHSESLSLSVLTCLLFVLSCYIT
jgi:hypothetical protein